jgi:transglutaminase superfamily protein
MTARRIRRFLALAVSSPSTTWLFVRMLAWNYSLRGLKGVLPFKTLLRLARPAPRAGVDQVQLARVELLLHRMSRHGDCLERSLVAYRFLLRAGARPTLYLGFDRDPPRRDGHAWVTVDGLPLLESSDFLERFAPVAVIGP